MAKKRRTPKGKKRRPDPDPIFQDTPWEIVQDERGRVVGEIYTLPARLTSRGNWRKR
ncbi:hypothetical protein ACFSL6_17860 [Paenibacillus thailandensis]|uniref:Transposase n=1 Tax=Paenibacillus thailandensis TaxID=393250 RepID=A0ABW5R2G1_9BACL